MSKDPFQPEEDPADTPGGEYPVAETSIKAVTPDAGAEPYHRYKFTFKSGSGYDAEWFTAAYPTLDEAEDDLTGAGAVQLARVLAAGSRVAAYFRGKGPGSQGSGGTASRPTTTSGREKPAGADEPPGWMGKPPFCEHGQRRFVSKKGAKGVWYAWGCPADKDDSSKCDGPPGSDDAGLIFKNKPKD